MSELTKGQLVVFKRNGKVKVGKVITKGPTKIGLAVADMITKTKIAASTELVPLTIYVTAEVKEELESLATSVV